MSKYGNFWLLSGETISLNAFGTVANVVELSYFCKDVYGPLATSMMHYPSILCCIFMKIVNETEIERALNTCEVISTWSIGIIETPNVRTFLLCPRSELFFFIQSQQTSKPFWAFFLLFSLLCLLSNASYLNPLIIFVSQYPNLQ